VLDTQGNPLNPASTLRDATGREGSFKEWNRLADAMERFHSHFRWEYDNIYRVSGPRQPCKPEFGGGEGGEREEKW